MTYHTVLHELFIAVLGGEGREGRGGGEEGRRGGGERGQSRDIIAATYS